MNLVEQQLIDREIKIAKIIELRKEFKTYIEIGQILGISKQRVHQLLKRIKGDNPNREEILDRDHYQCTICDSQKDLVVHHINGRDIENPDQFGNLATVCTKCHLKIHSADRKTIRPTEPKYFKEIKKMNDSKFRDKVIAEYNTLRQVRPTIQEIMNKVGCSRATVMNFVREYRASIGESHQPQRKRLS